MRGYAKKKREFKSKLPKPLTIQLLIEKCSKYKSWSLTVTDPQSVTLHSKAVITLSFSVSLSLFSYGKKAGLTLIWHYYSQRLNQLVVCMSKHSC